MLKSPSTLDKSNTMKTMKHTATAACCAAIMLASCAGARRLDNGKVHTYTTTCSRAHNRVGLPMNAQGQEQCVPYGSLSLLVQGDTLTIEATTDSSIVWARYLFTGTDGIQALPGGNSPKRYQPTIRKNKIVLTDMYGQYQPTKFKRAAKHAVTF
jgi:hypothetical protein